MRLTLLLCNDERNRQLIIYEQLVFYLDKLYRYKIRTF